MLRVNRRSRRFGFHPFFLHSVDVTEFSQAAEHQGCQSSTCTRFNTSRPILNLDKLFDPFYHIRTAGFFPILTPSDALLESLVYQGC